MGEELVPIEDEKTAFMLEMEKLRPDLMYPEIYKESNVKVVEELRPNKIKVGMLSAIPMQCRGNNCPVAKTCPLLMQNLAPVGSLCPIEMSMVQQFFQAYVEELGVDTDRLVEVSMVRSIVDQEIQYFRKTKLLSLEHFIQDNVVGIDSKDGTPIMRPELHMAVELEDRIHRRMERLRNQLLATRESRAKIGQSSVDASQTISNLIEKVNEMNRLSSQLLKKKLGKALEDEYIDAVEVVNSSDDQWQA